MKKLLLIVWTIACVIVPLIAQESGEGEPREPKGRVAWIVSTSIPEGLENPVTVMTGNDLVEVTLSKRNPSAPIKIPADGVVRVVRKAVDPHDPTKTIYTILAQALILEQVKQALIILLPIEKNPQGLLFETKVQDLAGFKGGDWLYLNTTQYKVGIEMGKTMMVVKPGEVKIYSAKISSEPLNIGLRYSVNDPEQEAWKVISSSTVALYPTRREICIFSWDIKNDRINYHGITFPVSE